MKFNLLIRIICFVSFSTLFISCEFDKCYTADHHSNGTLKKKISAAKEDNQEYWVESFYENGVLKSAYHFTDGKIEGNTSFFYESGKIRNRSYFKRGLKEGMSRHYRETDGRLDTEEFFYKGERVYSKYYDWENNDTIVSFRPVVDIEPDSILLKNGGDSIIFNFLLPLDDSLVNERVLFLAYEVKPISLRDSVINPGLLSEQKIAIGKPIKLTMKTLEKDSMLLYWHVVDKMNKKIYEPQERLFIRKDKLR